MRPWSPIALLLLLGACSSDFEMKTGDEAEPTLDDGVEEPANAAAPTDFWIDVEPVADGGSNPPLPESFGPFVDGSGFALVLASPVSVKGQVTARQVAPWFASPLPTREVDVPAQVVLTGLDRGGRYLTTTDADAEWSARVLPDRYQLTFVPDDPRVPASTELVVLEGDVTLDASLDAGVPLWGQVMEADGSPVSGAVVAASAPDGTRTEPVRTDVDGFYELRVLPGEWAVTTEGRVTARQPALSTELLLVGEEGGRADLTFAEEDEAELTLQVVEADRRTALTGVEVVLSSRALFGYVATQAVYTLEVPTDSRGFVDSRVPAGIYDVTITPRGDQPWSSVDVGSVTLSSLLDLGVIEVPPLRDLTTRVVDPMGEPLAGSTLQCRETIGVQRAWLATADEDGTVSATVADAPLRCLVGPPGDRPGLATSLLVLDGATAPESVVLREGALVSGTVTTDDGSPATGALVRLRDITDVVWAHTLTDTNGAYAFRVDFTPVVVTHAE